MGVFLVSEVDDGQGCRKVDALDLMAVVEQWGVFNSLCKRTDSGPNTDYLNTSVDLCWCVLNPVLVCVVMMLSVCVCVCVCVGPV